MTDQSAGSWFMRFIRACLWLLVAAICLNLAVCLVQGIWPWLVGGALVVIFCIGAVRMLQIAQRDKW